MRGSIAERGGVRVGHRIIEINNESVVATSHQHIVELLATTVGEVSIHPLSLMCFCVLFDCLFFALKALAYHVLLHVLIQQLMNEVEYLMKNL